MMHTRAGYERGYRRQECMFHNALQRITAYYNVLERITASPRTHAHRNVFIRISGRFVKPLLFS